MGKKLSLIFNKMSAEFCNPLVAELNAQYDVQHENCIRRPFNGRHLLLYLMFGTLSVVLCDAYSRC
jgi:hypothetical protein